MKHRKKSRGSLFKHYFTQITASLLFCLFMSILLMIFFFVNFWKTDIYSSLEKDVSAVEQSILNLDGSFDLASRISESIQTISYASPSGNIFITDSQGKIVVCTDMSDVHDFSSSFCFIHSNMHLPKEFMTELKAISGDYEYEGKIECFGEKTYFAVASSLLYYDGTDYFIIVAEATDDAYLPYTTEFVRMLILSSLIAILISFFTSLTVSYRMSRPIRTITDATKQYAAGDFSVKIPEMNSYNELESLIDSVNSMADSLSVLEESRSNFVANVSHELKTPMTIINGFIDGILDGTISGEDREKYLKIVSDEVKRLSKLVVAMLNMSKIEAGKLTLKRSDVNLGRMIFSILLTFEKVINEKDIAIEGLDNFDNIILNADDALINQILYNLIDNAVKFTPKNGTISIYLKNEKKYADIRIKNTGSGISSEDAALVFDRFYKVDKSRRLDSSSFGMGLYIVKGIVELHGGTISLDSDGSNYTEFRIKLPM